MIDDDFNNSEISRIELQNVADFLPYPFIIAEVISGVHWNTYLNEKFLEEIGYQIEEIPTIEKWYEMAYPDEVYRQNVIRLWDLEEIDSQRKGTVFVKMRSQVTCKNGSKRWYEIKASVVNKVHVVAFIDLDKEFTLQKELKEINSNNDRMLSILGHDLRSPIANLISVSSLALDKEISQNEFTEFIKLIKEQSTQVIEMLETTLNWAKLNFNNIHKHTIEIEIVAIITSILDIYKTALDAKNIKVTIVLNGNQNLNSDLEIMTIIIRNIISNSIKFTPQNGTITIECNQNHLTISDNGIGMTPEMIASIFTAEYFSRRGTNNEIGIGMGLQLVLNLAKKIQCEVEIESQETKGTTIRLLF